MRRKNDHQGDASVPFCCNRAFLHTSFVGLKRRPVSLKKVKRSFGILLAKCTIYKGVYASRAFHLSKAYKPLSFALRLCFKINKVFLVFFKWSALDYAEASIGTANTAVTKNPLETSPAHTIPQSLLHAAPITLQCTAQCDQLMSQNLPFLLPSLPISLPRLRVDTSLQAVLESSPSSKHTHMTSSHLFHVTPTAKCPWFSNSSMPDLT